MKKGLTREYLSVPDDSAPANAKDKDRFQWLPALQVQVAAGKRSPRMYAIVDSGSPWCIFRADVATLAGIPDIKTGAQQDIGGVVAGITEPMYFHRIRLYVERDWVIDVQAGFAEKLGATAILGRNGFFDNFVVQFDHTSHPPKLHVEKIDRA